MQHNHGSVVYINNQLARPYVKFKFICIDVMICVCLWLVPLRFLIAALETSPSIVTTPNRTSPKCPSPSTLVPTIRSPHNTLQGLAHVGKLTSSYDDS